MGRLPSSGKVFAMNTDLLAYYGARAAEYEEVYAKPERQQDLSRAKAFLQEAFRGKEVFEIACGTGYWTEVIAETADTVYASDANDAVLEIARSKNYSPAETAFIRADIFELEPTREYESLFGGFILSHMPLQQLDAFLDVCMGQVMEDGWVVLMDNCFVEGSNTPIAFRDDNGNTYQHRALKDGSVHSVLKNFPDENFLLARLHGRGKDIAFIKLDYYWMLKFRTY
jgi:demethylmenaquinone methyltransferase/2-methoxy-6-polyprenyl-1,4-benzoquinol methylase